MITKSDSSSIISYVAAQHATQLEDYRNKHIKLRDDIISHYPSDSVRLHPDAVVKYFMHIDNIVSRLSLLRKKVKTLDHFTAMQPSSLSDRSLDSMLIHYFELIVSFSEMLNEDFIFSAESIVVDCNTAVEKKNLQSATTKESTESSEISAFNNEVIRIFTPSKNVDILKTSASSLDEIQKIINLAYYNMIQDNEKNQNFQLIHNMLKQQNESLNKTSLLESLRQKKISLINFIFKIEKHIRTINNVIDRLSLSNIHRLSFDYDKSILPTVSDNSRIRTLKLRRISSIIKKLYQDPNNFTKEEKRIIDAIDSICNILSTIDSTRADIITHIKSDLQKIIKHNISDTENILLRLSAIIDPVIFIIRNQLSFLPSPQLLKKYDIKSLSQIRDIIIILRKYLLSISKSNNTFFIEKLTEYLRLVSTL